MSPRYQKWLQYVFDRPVTPNGWYFDLECPPFEAENNELAELIACTMENCGRDFGAYSDAQLRYGLEYIFNNSCSDAVFSIMDDAVPLALRLRAVEAIGNLYRDCFAQKCAPVLGHTSQPGGNPLNDVCYMLWDASPLSYWERSKDRQIFYRAISDVMAETLESENPACVESALHGLGHICSYYNDRVVEIIDAYLRRNVFVSAGLREYAQKASVGHVQ